MRKKIKPVLRIIAPTFTTILYALIGGYFANIIKSDIFALFIIISSFVLLVWVLGHAFSHVFDWFYDRQYYFSKLKPEEYNPLAREAFAKSLIDTGVSIAKVVLLTLFVLPLSLILKSVLDAQSEFELSHLLTKLPISFAVVLGLAFALSITMRQTGLKHLHEIEGKKNSCQKLVED